MNRKVVWHFVTEQMHGRRKRNTLNRLFKRLKIQRINDHVRLLNDHDDGTGYLVTGTDKALVIDTMYGQEDLKEAVKTLTDLPLMLVNTHGHFDHTYGNLYFDKAYIHPADIGIAEAYFKADGFVQMMKETGRRPAEFEPILEGTVIDLGGIELEIYETPGHTPGSIVLLDRKAWRDFARIIRISRFMSDTLTVVSMTTLTSVPVSVMPATVSSERSKQRNKIGIP